MIARNKGNELVILDDVDTPADDELSSGSSLSLSLSLVKNARESTKAKSCKRPSYLLALNNVVSSASRRVRREGERRQNQTIQAHGNASILSEGTMPPVLPAGVVPSMSFVHPAFGTGPTFYMLPRTIICRPDSMLFSPLG